ncbi:MAG TPA: rhomboid family intramembrane serine protease, partial [Chloroflexia bacterium]|nr:rhomboid family intramembrane serine protease [Chloroflexia bacterium]
MYAPLPPERSEPAWLPAQEPGPLNRETAPPYRSPFLVDLPRPARTWLRIPLDRPRLTLILLAVLSAIFMLMTVLGGSINATENADLLVKWGAKVNGRVYQGEWWRLITSTFLHAGILHIFLNGSALYFIGMDLEAFVGKARFAAVYAISGLGGSVASFIFSPFNVP